MPAIIAMTATSLYNIVDSVYIGHGCGALALGALTVAKPFMDICAAFGSLVGVGASSLLAIYLGEKDYDRANRVLGNVIVMNVILSYIEPLLRSCVFSPQNVFAINLRSQLHGAIKLIFSA